MSEWFTHCGRWCNAESCQCIQTLSCHCLSW